MEFPFGRELVGVLTELLGPRYLRFLVRFGSVAFVVWVIFFLIRTVIEGSRLFGETPITEAAGGILVAAFATIVLLMFFVVAFCFMLALAVRGMMIAFGRKDIREMGESIEQIQQTLKELQEQIGEKE